MNIQGKVALVTGGASGLGAASVRTIVAAGGRAMILDLNEKAGQALAGALGDAVRFVRADVSDPGGVEPAVETTTSPLRRLPPSLNLPGRRGTQRISGT